MEEMFSHAAVLGAAGKMGSGIALLLLQEMACELAAKASKKDTACLRRGPDAQVIPEQSLTLLDSNVSAFVGLRNYLREHLKKYAERHINSLRGWYAERTDLIDNGEMIECFVREAIDRVRFVSALSEFHDVQHVFEAIIEDVEIKSKVFRELDGINGQKAYYYTNTSSIPIHILEEKSGLKGRLIGFHFYNPPAVQKLLEIIVPERIDANLKATATEIGKRLNKTIVFSKDIAGFIGNGHFIREIFGALKKVRELEKTMPLTDAIFAVNHVFQDFLLRPMGIFQLIDYVGIDVCAHVAKIMSTYLNQSFHDPLIEEMLKAGITGGQHQDGKQKNGFLHYEKGVPNSAYDLKTKEYVSQQHDELGKLPLGHYPWKVLSKDSHRKEKIAAYFRHLWEDHTTGTELAKEFLKQSRAIAEGLVEDKVAASITDIDTVLQQGFFHLYGVNEPFGGE